MLVLILFYGLVINIAPRLPLQLHFLHALAWVFVHYVGLGHVLNMQSKNKFLVRHYLKNYHYSSGEGGGAVVEAFANWKVIYNLSMCMTYSMFPSR